jgi:hypothetical protein
MGEKFVSCAGAYMVPELMARRRAGVYIWAEGARYEGEYKEHKKHGRGLQTWPTGGR